MKKIAATFLAFVLLIELAPAVSAKPKGDWSDVKNLAPQEMLAVKTNDGVTSFGVLVAADDSGIRLNLADKEGISSQETSLPRNQIKKVWRAKLRFGERNTAKGTLIGLGAGFGVALISTIILSKTNPGDPPTGAGFFLALGAGIGAGIGHFMKKGHKKGQLVYSV